MASLCNPFTTSGVSNCINALTSSKRIPPRSPWDGGRPCSQRCSRTTIRCSAETNNSNVAFKTCRNCKKQFDPLKNHPRACGYHTAHFGDAPTCVATKRDEARGNPGVAFGYSSDVGSLMRVHANKCSVRMSTEGYTLMKESFKTEILKNVDLSNKESV